MRGLIAAPLLGLSLLGGCSEPQYLLTERTDAAPAATTSELRGVPARYTHHAQVAAPTQVISLAIDPSFSAEDRTTILAAVGEWNHVLNNAARLDVTSGAVPYGWAISMSALGVLPADLRNPQPLAVDLRTGKTSGVIVVYVNRIKDPNLLAPGAHDLRGVMVHELGVALGGGNGSTLYTSKVRDCIDQNMAMSVGSVLDIPTAQLNWCETDATVAAR